MQGIHPADRLPLVTAAVVMVAVNAAGFFIGTTIYMSILGAPLAVAAFGLLRYLDDGTPYPAALSG
ncbi:hypothetical protein DP107_17185 [Haloglomus irregulare]|jgi:hypothetical protein|uniref:Uncharacterized protein n=2 Tax=Halobacteriales TaxID=2235 RepID=A0A554MV48_9EURY|nr:hypothetical protein [Haloglomus irregulare]ABT17375.1 hypothetical protein [uncultured haloarchaeon FLAS10H9]TSD09004.1 hypothetical protein DP107_17185 [Haloglomus irregulare]